VEYFVQFARLLQSSGEPVEDDLLVAGGEVGQMPLHEGEDEVVWD